MIELVQAMAAFINVCVYIRYIFKTEPTTMWRQLTGVSEPIWGWIIPAYKSLLMSYENPKGSGQ